MSTKINPHHIQIQKDLQAFYDGQAEKFSNTRNKHPDTRPEIKYILEYIKLYTQTQKKNPVKSKIKIIELGCGDGRLYKYIYDLCDEIGLQLEYIGVDISSGLISIAQKNRPNAQWYVSEMELRLSQNLDKYYNQIDIIISIAAIQHLTDDRSRNSVLSMCYQINKYVGYIIITNRSISQRFIKKYRQVLMDSFITWLFEKHDITDLYIPRKDHHGNLVSMRYYHIFGLSSISRYISQAGYIVISSNYINRNGIISDTWRDSRNSFIVASKDIEY